MFFRKPKLDPSWSISLKLGFNTNDFGVYNFFFFKKKILVSLFDNYEI